MSYEQRRNYISLITTAVVSVPFVIYILQRFQASHFTQTEALHFWISAILVLIPLRIVAEIIVTILASIAYAIATNNQPDKELVDEMDKLIGLKALRNSYYGFACGILVTLLLTIVTLQVEVLFVGLLVIGMISEMVEIASKIYYYS
jgi:hypothetical protein